MDDTIHIDPLVITLSPKEDVTRVKIYHITLDLRDQQFIEQKVSAEAIEDNTLTKLLSREGKISRLLKVNFPQDGDGLGTAKAKLCRFGLRFRDQVYSWLFGTYFYRADTAEKAQSQ
jgi:hypothetical protein